jgi:DNA-binding transcriptional ArsR family regulator
MLRAEQTMSNSREERFVDGDKVRQAHLQLIDGSAAIWLAELFKALADPSRVRIISALTYTELCVHDLAVALDMSQSAVSHQLRSLREMRLVRFRKEGRHVYYQLDDEHIRDLFRRGLEHVEHG